MYRHQAVEQACTTLCTKGRCIPCSLEFWNTMPCCWKRRVGQNWLYTPCVTVIFVISLPRIPWIHHIYVVLAIPKDDTCRDCELLSVDYATSSNRSSWVQLACWQWLNANKSNVYEFKREWNQTWMKSNVNEVKREWSQTWMTAPPLFISGSGYDCFGKNSSETCEDSKSCTWCVWSCVCVRMCVYVCVHVCECVWVHVRVRMVYVCVCLCVCMCVFVCMYVCVCVPMRACVCLQVAVRTGVGMGMGECGENVMASWPCAEITDKTGALLTNSLGVRLFHWFQ